MSDTIFFVVGIRELLNPNAPYLVTENVLYMDVSITVELPGGDKLRIVIAPHLVSLFAENLMHISVNESLLTVTLVSDPVGFTESQQWEFKLNESDTVVID